MDIPKYYVIELLEDINTPWNKEKYQKGIRLMVWEDRYINCYWAVNSGDNIRKDCAKKLFEFEGREVIY